MAAVISCGVKTGAAVVTGYKRALADGAEVVKGPYVAETVPVTVEEQYVVVEF